MEQEWAACSFNYALVITLLLLLAALFVSAPLLRSKGFHLFGRRSGEYFKKVKKKSGRLAVRKCLIKLLNKA